MAIVKFVASGCPMNNIFPYVMNREKTDENLISGINCSPDTVLQEFMFVKKQFKKEDGRTYVHIVQAFSPDDDITPETAHEIGLRFAEYFGGFQALVATHRNTDHIHNGEVPFLPFRIPRHANLLILEKLDRAVVRCFHLIPRSAQVILFCHVTTCNSLYVLLIE